MESERKHRLFKVVGAIELLIECCLPLLLRLECFSFTDFERPIDKLCKSNFDFQLFKLSCFFSFLFFLQTKLKFLFQSLSISRNTLFNFICLLTCCAVKFCKILLDMICFDR